MGLNAKRRLEREIKHVYIEYKRLFFHNEALELDVVRNYYKVEELKVELGYLERMLADLTYKVRKCEEVKEEMDNIMKEFAESIGKVILISSKRLVINRYDRVINFYNKKKPHPYDLQVKDPVREYIDILDMAAWKTAPFEVRYNNSGYYRRFWQLIDTCSKGLIVEDLSLIKDPNADKQAEKNTKIGQKFGMKEWMYNRVKRRMKENRYRITGCYNHVNNPQENLDDFFLLEAEKQVPLRFDRDTKDIIDSNPESDKQVAVSVGSSKSKSNSKKEIKSSQPKPSLDLMIMRCIIEIFRDSYTGDFLLRIQNGAPFSENLQYMDYLFDKNVFGEIVLEKDEIDENSEVPSIGEELGSFLVIRDQNVGGRQNTNDQERT